MLAKLQSVALSGIDATLLQIEVDISSGIPGMTIVGLPDASVKESKDRVKAAVNNSKFQFPFKKLTVNLAPANIRKEGPCYDLPIAIGTLMASGILPETSCDEYALVGELSLEGELRPVCGALSMAIAAKQMGATGIILPHANALEAAVVKGINVIPVRNLIETAEFISGAQPIEPLTSLSCHSELSSENHPDFREVIGQENAKQAMLVAAAGGHNILMVGPPGSGKTMLAQRLLGILPPLNFDESLETTRVYSVAGLLKEHSGLLETRPFRSPHHTISDAGLTGGGSRPRPGEISLAHHGVLFLDELPEFKRGVLEVLRQPLEEGDVTISRAYGNITYPAEFMLVASMNPCPCGYFGDAHRPCHCTPGQVERYVNKISGPLLDRIDLHVEVESVDPEQISSKYRGLSSLQLRQKVLSARERQINRFKETGKDCNAKMTPQEVSQFCSLDSETQSMFIAAMRQLGLSARGYHRVLKVSRTIADLDDQDQIQQVHLAEALGYRSLDRKLWMP